MDLNTALNQLLALLPQGSEITILVSASNKAPAVTVTQTTTSSNLKNSPFGG